MGGLEAAHVEAREGRGVYPVLDGVPPNPQHKRALDGPADLEESPLAGVALGRAGLGTARHVRVVAGCGLGGVDGGLERG